MNDRGTAPAIAVVVPTYNRAPSLARLLDAIDPDEVAALGAEIVVVDDGSSDGTADVVAASSLPVHLVRQANQGPAAARNAGWRAATAPIVVFVDDDCVPQPGWLTDHAAAFDDERIAGAGGTIEALVGGFVADFVTADGSVDHGRAPGGDADADPTYLVTANASFRRTALVEAHGFAEHYRAEREGATGRITAGEDVDLCWRLVDAGWRLVRADGATVAHDHRIAVPALVRTYLRQGRARRSLGRRHAGRGAGEGLRRVMTARHWLDRVERYRDGGRRSVPRVAGFLALRIVVLAAYGAGVVASVIDERRGR